MKEFGFAILSNIFQVKAYEEHVIVRCNDQDAILMPLSGPHRSHWFASAANANDLTILVAMDDRENGRAVIARLGNSIQSRCFVFYESGAVAEWQLTEAGYPRDVELIVPAVREPEPHHTRASEETDNLVPFHSLNGDAGTALILALLCGMRHDTDVSTMNLVEGYDMLD